MKVNELIKTLSEKPQDAEVFFLIKEDEGLREITKVTNATPVSDEMKAITGDEFVLIE